jgi:hypothetical protein
MKVKDLLKVIKERQKDYADFLEWDIALEQHPDYKECSNCNEPEDSIIDHDLTKGDTLFIKSHAMECCSYFTKKKIFGIQIHY